MSIKYPEISLSVQGKARNIVIILLSAATIFGLFSGLLYAINLELNSDMIVPGLVAKEIINYHNFQFFFPASDPYLFTDTIPFHLITQAISGYDPLVLKLTAYVIFMLAVGMFAYLIYRYTGIVNALIFSALFANMSPEAYLFFISPVHHIGTLLATGLLIYLFSVDRIKNASLTNIVIVCLIAGLMVLSDSIFLIFFIVPWIIYYVYFHRIKNPLAEDMTIKTEGKSKKETARMDRQKQKERSNLDKAVILLLFFTALSFIVTYYFGENVNINGPNFISTPTSLVHIDYVISTSAPILTNSLSLLLNGNLHNFVAGNFNLFNIFVSILFLSLVLYSLLMPNKNLKYLYLILLVSAVLMVLGFLFTDWAKGIGSARYLIFIALAVFAVLALAYRDDRKIGYNLNTLFLAVILILVLSTVPASIAKISGLDFQPNKDEYAFIDYLEDGNFTYGYSDYWTAHSLTYLSRGQLTILPIQIKENKILPISWLTTKRWYITRHPNYFVIASKNDKIYTDMINRNISYPADNLYYYKDYIIYQYKSNVTGDVRWFY